MSELKINQKLVTPEIAEEMVNICPFGAISVCDGKLSVSSACKMCRLCVKKGPKGVAEFVEDEAKEINNALWRGICVFADCSGGKIHRVTYELIGKARELANVINHPVYVLIIGSDTQKCAEKILYYGVDKIFTYDNAGLKDFRIEPFTNVFCDFIEKVKPSSVLVGATNLGRQLAPRVAARCRTGLTADCTVLNMKENTDLVQIRPAFGGNIMAQIISPNNRPQFCTVRYKVFSEPMPENEKHGEIVNLAVDEKALLSGIKIISVNEKPKDIDISEADVIVAVGRGAKSEALRTMAGELCELLGGVLACSRPLVEENIMDSKHQIGLSGRTVKPKFIICLGISGAVQFAAGMKGSDCILAINSDKNAPIFDVAHYSLVGDLNDVLPRLVDKIREDKRNVQ